VPLEAGVEFETELLDVTPARYRIVGLLGSREVAVERLRFIFADGPTIMKARPRGELREARPARAAGGRS
jgi:hypothetical protein